MKKHLEINTKWCKGCGICVEFCPREALALDGGKVTLANPYNCVTCGICESLCPDFAIFVVKEEGDNK